MITTILYCKHSNAKIADSWARPEILAEKDSQATMTPYSKCLVRGRHFCCSTLFLEAICGILCLAVFFHDFDVFKDFCKIKRS